MQSHTHSHANNRTYPNPTITQYTPSHAQSDPQSHSRFRGHTHCWSKHWSLLDLVNSRLLSSLLCASTFLSIICKMGTQMPPTQGDQGCSEVRHGKHPDPGGAGHPLSFHVLYVPSPPLDLHFFLSLPSNFHWALTLQSNPASCSKPSQTSTSGSPECSRGHRLTSE